MSTHLGSARRLTPRRLLAAFALAAVVALGVSMSAPAGPASAAPAAAPTSAVLTSRVVTTTADPVGASDRAATTHRITISHEFIDAFRNGPINARAMEQRATYYADLVCGADNLGAQCRIDVATLLMRNRYRCSYIVAYIPQLAIKSCG
jgi:hypothetical protein